MNRFAAAAAASSVPPMWWGVAHRRSDAVRRWTPPQLPTRFVAGQYVRIGGDGDTVVVLLHGLVATGDVFGAAFDSLSDRCTLAVPDLLGFGRSIDESRTDFSAEVHLDALDRLLDEVDVGDRPVVVGAHSMGCALALRWAARRGPQITRIVGWGAPVYRDSSGVDAQLADTGVMARLFAGNTRLAEWACGVNCRHRTATGWLAAAVAPELPTRIARSASLHTWPAYRDAISNIVADTDWEQLASSAAANGTTVELAWGEHDPIGDREFARTLPGLEIHTVPNAGHHLPMSHGTHCVDQLRLTM